MLKHLMTRRVAFFLWMIMMTTYGMWKLFGQWFLIAVCLYVVYYAVKHRRLLAATRAEDWVNPAKWLSVLYASFMKMLFPIHIVEQLIIRMFDPECRKCMKQGFCTYCKCDMSKVYTPWDTCSEGNYPEMIEDETEYREMRKEFPVKIDVSYPKEEAKSGTWVGRIDEEMA